MGSFSNEKSKLPVKTGSSSSSCKEARKGCLSAYSVVIRRSGFMSKSLSIKSKASGGVFGNTDSSGYFSFSGNDFTYFNAYSLDIRLSVC